MRWRLLLVAAVGLPAIAAEPSSRRTTGAGANACTLAFEHRWYVDQAPRVRLVVEPLADSVLVGEYFTLGPRGLTTEPPYPNARGTLVFGQLARVVTAQGLDHEFGSDPRDVVLIWWGMAPSAIVSLPRGLWAPRPVSSSSSAWAPGGGSEWIAGAPTFDIDVPDDRVPGVYGPSRTRLPVPTVGAPMPRLTAREFAAAVMQLPTAVSVRRDRDGARRSLLAWGERNPEIAQRYPITDFIAAARAEEAAAHR